MWQYTANSKEIEETPNTSTTKVNSNYNANVTHTKLLHFCKLQNQSKVSKVIQIPLPLERRPGNFQGELPLD